MGSLDAGFNGSDAPGFTTGQVNGAISFSGRDQSLSTAAAGNPTAALTVMAWINPVDLTRRDRGILAKKDAFILEIESDGARLSFTMINGGSYREFEPTVAANQIPENSWSQVTATFDGTITVLYINGQPIDSEVSGFIGPANSNEPYYIAWTSHTAFGTNRYFNGAIDEVALFDRALSAPEIAQLYNESLAGQSYCGN